MAQPWETGDEISRWHGYLLDDGKTLRNRVGATTPDDLRRAEDHLVETRALSLREHDLPGTYDLAGLQAVHRHMFQDVYDWAGELRTVSIRKSADTWFTPVPDIEPSMEVLAGHLRASDNLRAIDAQHVPGALATVYDIVNQAHPFREGNGRVQREFLSALASESGHHIDWTKVTASVGDRENENDRVSRLALAGDNGPMRDMFARIVTRADRDSFDVAAFEAVRIAQAGRVTRPRSSEHGPRPAAPRIPGASQGHEIDRT